MPETDTREALTFREHFAGPSWALGLVLGLALAVPGCADLSGDESVEEDSEGEENLSEKAFTSTLYEAETYSAQSGCAVATNQTGYTGTGFVDYGGNGTWAEWNTINAAAAGLYTLTFKYANGGANARPAALTVNSTSAGTAQFNPTSAWSSWSTVSLDVTLRQGNNTIRATANTSTGGPNVDSLSVIAKDLCTSDPNKVEPGLCGCGVPEGSCPVQLPVEVFGPAGAQADVSLRLDAVDGITHLLITCHSCGYNDHALDADATKVKAAVRVNGGPQIALKHYTLTADGKVAGTAGLTLTHPDDAKYGGIGGGFRTNTMLVPVTGLRVGTNTFSFVHVRPDTLSIGFRIVALNLVKNGSSSAKVFDSTRFVDDDPSKWTVQGAVGSSDATVVQNAVSAGRTLWYKTNHLYDPGLDMLDGVRGSGTRPLDGKISASCSDCHAQDGRDLKYFNFSNLSIIERSYFHGLSRTDGRKIAAYIRSLNLPIVALARPWNPPYQPGPGIDARPAYEWAAGAGLGAVLNSDADMKTRLFPSGTTAQSVRAVVNRLGTLNMRQLPVALQMPDWNQWLPTVHPRDGFNTTAPQISQDEKGVAVAKPFYDLLYDAAKTDPSSRNIGDLITRIEKWFTRGGTCYTQTLTRGPGWRATNSLVAQAVTLGAGVPANATETQCEQLRYGIDPVWWTPRNARQCARSDPWQSGSEESLHPSSRPTPCDCARLVVEASDRLPRTWT